MLTPILAVLLWPTYPDTLADLKAPRHVLAHHAPIDIQRSGRACPFFGDFDGDGRNDLLVGESFAGRLRIYRNLGTAQEPVFGDYEWFRAGGKTAAVPWHRGGYKGFSPQLIDLDGDGQTDLLSGCYLGELHWFRRIEGTTFVTAVKLSQTDDNSIKTPGAQPACADWDSDGDIDIVVGTLAGEILLLTNEGPRRNPRFAAPVPVLAAGEPIKSEPGWVHPCVADWNGDGRVDLIVGLLDGSVLLFENEAMTKDPQFGEPTVLVEPSGQTGRQAALCVADFNADGHMDLLLGDGSEGVRERVQLQPFERSRAEQGKVRLDTVRKQWAAAFARYRHIESDSLDDSLVRGETVEGEQLRVELELLRDQVAAAQLNVEYYAPHYNNSGFVWVFIRRPAGRN